MQKHQNLIRAEQIIDRFLVDLKTIVNIDSGTFVKAGIDLLQYLQQHFHEFGFATESTTNRSMAITLSQHIWAAIRMVRIF